MTRGRALRVWLLLSLGAAACGGTVTNSHDSDGNAGSGDTAPGQGGSGSTAPGASAKPPAGPASGGSGVGPGTAGKPSLGGLTTAGGGGQPMTHCSSPSYDSQTGFVICAEGYEHRLVALACGALAAQGGEPALGGAAGAGAAGGVPPTQPDLPRTDGSVVCGYQRADCNGYENGYCNTPDIGVGGDVGFCQSGCTSDEDCGPGFICTCDEAISPTGGACRPSNCTTDSDCGNGYNCASYDGSLNGRSRGFACQRAGDACRTDTDCPPDKTCEWNQLTGKRSCDEFRVGN